MDAKSRREWVRGWLAVGLREGLTFKEVAERARMKPRTLRRWNARLRKENELRTTTDGVVTDVLVREGQSVEAGTLLAIVTPS